MSHSATANPGTVILVGGSPAFVPSGTKDFRKTPISDERRAEIEQSVLEMLDSRPESD